MRDFVFCMSLCIERRFDVARINDVTLRQAEAVYKFSERGDSSRTEMTGLNNDG